jgi:hypothetical protein
LKYYFKIKLKRKYNMDENLMQHSQQGMSGPGGKKPPAVPLFFSFFFFFFLPTSRRQSINWNQTCLWKASLHWATLKKSRSISLHQLGAPKLLS